MSGKVVAEQSISLDGVSAGPNVSRAKPLGDGGDRLHAWMGDAGATVERKEVESLLTMAGAFIMGRRMFDVGVEPWGDPPPFRNPVFVLSHRAHKTISRRGGTTYHFVTEGIDAALAKAKAAAATKPVAILGGANVVRQYLDAGLVDELLIHLVPLVLGDGTRLFDGVTPRPLVCTKVVEAPGVTHLVFGTSERLQRASLPG